MKLLGPVFPLFLLFTWAVAPAEEKVPRVLVLGDPIQRNVLSAAAKDLEGKARIEFPRVAAHDTGNALAKIDELLGEGQWDLIYFNFGFGDLFYKDPRSQEIRAMSKKAGGVRVSSPEHYRKNLEAIVKRLKETKARLLWASTTPMINVNAFPGYMGNLFDAHSELAYNGIAEAIMQRHGVPINDMHAFILAQFGPEEKHPGHEGYQKALSGSHRGKAIKGFDKKPMHQPVVEAILEQLK